MNPWRPADEYALGFCDGCGLPVYKPEWVTAPGCEGCQCETPQLYTFEQMAKDAAASAADRAKRLSESPITRPTDFSIWKKRAKRL